MFGSSRNLMEIMPDQGRRFANTSACQRIHFGQSSETAERTVVAWENLAEKDPPPREMMEASGAIRYLELAGNNHREV